MRGYKSLIILCFILVVPMQMGFGQAESIDEDDDQNMPTPSVAAADESSRQLRIYTDTLLAGASESIRLDAAMSLLIRKDEAAQEVLLAALGAKDNPMAQTAVCRAIIKGRTLGMAVVSLHIYLKPLIDVMNSQDAVLAHLAAEALLVYRFDQISGPLLEIAQSATIEKQARLNAIYAFQVRPEPDALRSLINLLNDSDEEVVRAAELALQESFGVPVGTDRDVWAKILKDLEKKDPSEIRRERLLRQETRLREIQAERDRWQKLYLAVLDKEFEPLEAGSKTSYLTERLGSDLPAIRLWALEKLGRYTAESAAGLREKLLALLSDENRLVRLATAKVLSTMSALNPAERLLSRYKEEADPQVAMAIFEALGEACFFAFSPGSKITLPAEVKTETLQIADSYTVKEDPEMAKKGAEVLRKLLELNGLTARDTQHYLQTILDRYEEETLRKGPIRGELLTTMARLCGQGSQKTEAIKLYADVFRDVLRANDENNLVRQAAATGMVNGDKTAAMELFRELNLGADSSPAVRQVMIELAGQMGTADDLEWLVSQLGNGQNESTWQAMVSILQRQESRIIIEWVNRIELNPVQSGQSIELMELAEQKAAAQKEDILLCQTQIRMLKWFWGKGQYEQVAVYRDKLMQKNPEKEYVQDALRQTDYYAMDAYLQARRYLDAANIIDDLLGRGLLNQNTDVVKLADDYLNSEKNTAEDKKDLFSVLSEIPVTIESDWWRGKLEQWRGLLSDISPQTSLEPTKQ